MKIERISENQVKFILSSADLSERNIKLAELSYGSEKTQELFREMLEQAVQECDFRPEQDTPLIIEAIPLSNDSIVIIVTKTHGDEDKRPTLVNALRDLRRKIEGDEAEEKPAEETGELIFAFKTFDDAAELADRIFGQFRGKSSLYLMDKKYYLTLDARRMPPRERQELEFVLMDYAQKVFAAPTSRVFLEEHGDVIVSTGALATLWDYHNA